MRLVELASARFVEPSAKINAKIASRTEHTLTSQISIDSRKVFLFLGFVRFRKFRLWEEHCDEIYAEGEKNHFAKRLPPPASEYIDKAFRENSYFLFVRWFIALAFIEFLENYGGKLSSHIAKRQFSYFWLNCNQRQLIPAIRGLLPPRLYSSFVANKLSFNLFIDNTIERFYADCFEIFVGRRNLLQLNFHLCQ